MFANTLTFLVFALLCFVYFARFQFQLFFFKCVLLCALLPSFSLLLPGRHFYTRAWPLSNTCALFFRFQVFAVCSLLLLAVVVVTTVARRALSLWLSASI